MTDVAKEAIARIELYVPEKAVLRHEEEIQRWIEFVSAPLRYVCSHEPGQDPTRVDTPLGATLKDFKGAPRPEDRCTARVQMSAFSGFSMAPSQKGVWFREGSGDTEEDRVTIYSFIVRKELADVAYFALRERVAKRILRARNEQTVMMTMQDSAFRREFVWKREAEYGELAKAFHDCAEDNPDKSYGLVCSLVHLFQLVEREMWAHLSGENKNVEALRHLDGALTAVAEALGLGHEPADLITRVNPGVLMRWVRILTALKQPEHLSRLRSLAAGVLKRTPLEVADAYWRFPTHPFAGAGYMNVKSCGIEGLLLLATIGQMAMSEKNQVAGATPMSAMDFSYTKAIEMLWNLGAQGPLDPMRKLGALAHDWRSMSVSLSEGEGLGSVTDRDLAKALAFQSPWTIESLGFLDEASWYESVIGNQKFPQ